MDGGTDWVALYKLARLALLACVLSGIAVWLRRRPELEQVARRMLEDDAA
jgi:hypothetical protein